MTAMIDDDLWSAITDPADRVEAGLSSAVRAAAATT